MTKAFLLKEHPHHRNLRGAVSRISLEEARRQLQALEVKNSEVPILTLRCGDGKVSGRAIFLSNEVGFS